MITNIQIIQADPSITPPSWLPPIHLKAAKDGVLKVTFTFEDGTHLKDLKLLNVANINGEVVAFSLYEHMSKSLDDLICTFKNAGEIIDLRMEQSGNTVCGYVEVIPDEWVDLIFRIKIYHLTTSLVL